MIDHSQRNRYKLKKNYITNFQNIKIKFNTQKREHKNTNKVDPTVKIDKLIK